MASSHRSGSAGTTVGSQFRSVDSAGTWTSSGGAALTSFGGATFTSGGWSAGGVAPVGGVGGGIGTWPGGNLDAAGFGAVLALSTSGKWPDGGGGASSARHTNQAGAAGVQFERIAASGCTGGLESISDNANLCVPKLREVAPPAGIRSYRIDATEVTRAQYESWTKTQPSPPARTDPNCGWNRTFVPESQCMALAAVCQSNCEHHPQVCIDWCDAAAFCTAAGKRLCGAVTGGATYFTDYTDPDRDQWYRACTSGGKYSYPYGEEYIAEACNGHDDQTTSAETTVEVGSRSGCTSNVPGYTEVIDLSGNVAEWEDGCMVGDLNLVSCLLRGGSFRERSDSWLLKCGTQMIGQSSIDATIGFRCCS